MMRFFDFSSWQGILTTLLGLTLITLIGVGIRVVMMLRLQARQQRMNRQINERLKTLIAAYRVPGGSFTSELTVNPAHLRDLRLYDLPEDSLPEPRSNAGGTPGADRSRRIRDAVEGALSDILLLGIEEHVHLAGQAARDMAAGRPIQTAALVTSLRSFIRVALDLEPIPDGIEIPAQGPTRPFAGGGNRSGSRGESGAGGRGGAGGGSGGGGTSGLGLGPPPDPK